MKFYVLKHPEFGYLRSKAPYRTLWTDTIEKAKKWNQRNHPTGIRTQTYSKSIKECEVIEIDYEIDII